MIFLGFFCVLSMKGIFVLKNITELCSVFCFGCYFLHETWSNIL